MMMAALLLLAALAEATAFGVDVSFSRKIEEGCSGLRQTADVSGLLADISGPLTGPSPFPLMTAFNWVADSGATANVLRVEAGWGDVNLTAPRQGRGLRDCATNGDVAPCVQSSGWVYDSCQYHDESWVSVRFSDHSADGMPTSLCCNPYPPLPSSSAPPSRTKTTPAAAAALRGYCTTSDDCGYTEFCWSERCEDTAKSAVCEKFRGINTDDGWTWSELLLGDSDFKCDDGDAGMVPMSSCCGVYVNTVGVRSCGEGDFLPGNATIRGVCAAAVNAPLLLVSAAPLSIPLDSSAHPAGAVTIASSHPCAAAALFPGAKEAMRWFKGNATGVCSGFRVDVSMRDLLDDDGRDRIGVTTVNSAPGRTVTTSVTRPARPITFDSEKTIGSAFWLEVPTDLAGIRTSPSSDDAERVVTDLSVVVLPKAGEVGSDWDEAWTAWKGALNATVWRGDASNLGCDSMVTPAGGQVVDFGYNTYKGAADEAPLPKLLNVTIRDVRAGDWILFVLEPTIGSHGYCGSTECANKSLPGNSPRHLGDLALPVQFLLTAVEASVENVADGVSAVAPGLLTVAAAFVASKFL